MKLGLLTAYWAIVFILPISAFASDSRDCFFGGLKDPKSDPKFFEDVTADEIQSAKIDSFQQVKEGVREFGRKAEKLLQELKYDVVSLAGVGGNAIAYVVLTPTKERKILKVLIPGNERSIGGLEREALVMNDLHAEDGRFLPSLHRVIGPADNRLHTIEMPLVTEHLGSSTAAPNLYSLITQGEDALTLADRISIRHQLHALVRAAHKLGVYHLDLKLGNILVSRDAERNVRAHLIDWGDSNSKERGASPNERPGNAFGTMEYITEDRYRGLLKDYDAEDTNALRFLDWYLRLANRNSNGVFVTRTRYPRFGTDTGNYTSPARALDDFGPESERLSALAEWTRVARRLSDRDALLKMARTQSRPEFLANFGRMLIDAERPTESADLYKRRLGAAQEILSSHLLSENWTTALKLSPEEMREIARSVAYLRAKYEPILQGRENPGPFEPHKEMLWAEFEAAYLRSGLSPSWKELQEVAGLKVQAEGR